MLHLKLAWRQLRKHRFFTLLNVLGLTVGMAAAIALFLYVQKEFSFDRYHANADRICRVNLAVDYDGTAEKWASAPNITGPALVEAIPEVQEYVRLLHHNFGRTASVAYEEKRLKEEMLFWADSTLTSVFDIPILSGNEKQPLDRPGTAMINERTAKRIFGEEDPIGKQLLVDNESSLEVTAVFADMPDNSSWQPNIIGSFSSVGWAYRRLYWSNASFETFLLMQAGYDLAVLDQKMQTVLDDAIEKEEQWFTLFAQPLTDIHLHSQGILEGYSSELGDAKQVRLIAVLAFVVLLLACFNYINLTTARAQQRLREVGISKAVGASSGHMMVRFLTETALLSGSAIVFALALISWLSPQLSTVTNRDLDWWQLSDGYWWISIPCTWLIVTLVAGIYPAITMGSTSAKQLLQPEYKRGGGQSILRRSLVVGQFVVCIALIAGALICQEQIAFLGQKKLGYGADAVIALNLAGSSNESAKNALVQRVAAHPDVTNVSRAQSFPGIGTSGYSLINPTDPDVPHPVSANRTEPGAEELLGIELLAGHFLKPRAEGDTVAHLVVNEHFISILGWSPEEAIGRSPDQLFGTATKIDGVVKDFHFESLHHPITAYVMHNGQGRANPNFLLARVRPEALDHILTDLKDLSSEYLPEAAFDYTFLDQTVAGFYEGESRLSRVVWIFTALTIFISALGLLGLATFAAAQRTKEISIRKVLGASVHGIVLLLSREFLLMVLLSTILAVPLGWWAMQKWLSNFAYSVEVDWKVFAFAGGLAIMVALLTIAGQSWRAATRNPVDALRNE
ncbi:MAG: FtsX-like permease family protein [Bacteroidota bacterium]